MISFTSRSTRLWQEYSPKHYQEREAESWSLYSSVVWSSLHCTSSVWWCLYVWSRRPDLKDGPVANVWTASDGTTSQTSCLFLSGVDWGHSSNSFSTGMWNEGLHPADTEPPSVTLGVFDSGLWSWACWIHWWWPTESFPGSRAETCPRTPPTAGRPPRKVRNSTPSVHSEKNRQITSQCRWTWIVGRGLWMDGVMDWPPEMGKPSQRWTGWSTSWIRRSCRLQAERPG